jgi:hypothetical protein
MSMYAPRRESSRSVSTDTSSTSYVGAPVI